MQIIEHNIKTLHKLGVMYFKSTLDGRLLLVTIIQFLYMKKMRITKSIDSPKIPQCKHTV